MIERLQHILSCVLHGDLKSIYTLETLSFIQNEAVRLLRNKAWNQMDIAIAQLLIKISQIIYNNTDAMCPIEDGIYDQLIVTYAMFDPLNYQVGGEPVIIQNEGRIAPEGESNEIINPIIFVDPSVREGLFYNNLMTRTQFDPRLYDRQIDRSHYEKNTDQVRSVPHTYPKLVGTLDKCKFVLVKEAVEAGVIDDPSIVIFERDFLGKQLMQGYFDQNTHLRLLLELKYDGMSVEADVTDHIHSARSRGDANADQAQDLTIPLKNYPFFQCKPIPDNEKFGMKFEAIITKHNIDKLAAIKGRQPYKNGRNGIVGLMGSLDVQAFQDLITLVPLETSLDIDPITEVQFMNQFYTSGVPLIYAIAEGTYTQVLYQVYKFVKEAEAIRPMMDFMYDGVVVHHTDPVIRQRLGRVNNVNKYSIAIKFNPTVKEAIFLGYSFTVGQNGVVTPMLHYTPVEFFGTIHTKSSGHSYARFKELNLSVGEVINLTYRNDVMPYASRPNKDVIEYVNYTSQKVPFPTHCPFCGTQLQFSEKSAVCPNLACPERVIMRLGNMLAKVSFKGFSKAALKAMNVTSFTDFMSIDYDRAKKGLGEVLAAKFMTSMTEFKTKKMYDYFIVGALGFESVAQGTWMKILHEIHLNEILSLSIPDLYNRLSFIKGIGNKIAEVVVMQRDMFYNDLLCVASMPNVVCTYHMIKVKSIRFTGFRDRNLEARLKDMGYDANGDASVTKSTSILLIPHVGFTSEKLKKAGEKTLIVPVDEFERNMNYYLSL